jgi:hypothetical protein
VFLNDRCYPLKEFDFYEKSIMINSVTQVTVPEKHEEKSAVSFLTLPNYL